MRKERIESDKKSTKEYEVENESSLERKNLKNPQHQGGYGTTAKKFLAIAKFGLLLIILVGIPLYIYFFQKDLIESFSSFENIKAFFYENKGRVMITYLILQCLQIIICIIPGQGLQFAVGYFYGIPIGFVLSMFGALIGSIITYYLAKILGHDAVHLFFGEEKIKAMIHRLNSKKAAIIIFFIFLIPGVPKDLCNYAAGLSEMKLKPFLVVSMIGRSAGILGSVVIGSMINSKNYVVAIIIAVIALILFILGIIYHKKVNNYLDKMYDKYIGKDA